MNFIKYSIITLYLNRKNNDKEIPGKWINSKKKRLRVAKATVHGNCCWEIQGKKSWRKQRLPFGSRKRGTSVSIVHRARALKSC